MNTPQPPPAHSSPLAHAVGKIAAQYPRRPVTDKLTVHRDELLRLRREGHSIETLAGGLRMCGVQVGNETLRRWLSQELGSQPARRRKSRIKQLALGKTNGVNDAMPPA